MDNDLQPIGYRLKELDRLIEDIFDHALAEQSLVRRHWQTMNALHAGLLSTTALAQALRPFWGEDVITLDDVLGELANRGWISEPTGDLLALSADGQRAYAAVCERVRATRRLMLTGLSREQYLATIDVLRQMASNLESAHPPEHQGTGPPASSREPRTGLPQDPRRAGRPGSRGSGIDSMGDS
jgi:DNA-binding MarR family transcriptional regulator